MYHVFGAHRSRAFRVLWLLEELGLDYKHTAAAPRSDEIKAVYPRGKVPAITDGDTVLTDSVAIMSYLSDKHDARLGAPAGTIARAQLDAMLHRINEEVDALLWAAAKHSFIYPEERRVPDVKESIKWEFARNMDALADDLGDKPFLMGDEMTIADILLTHCGGWAITAKFPKTPKENLGAYFKRMVARDAYQKARGG